MRHAVNEVRQLKVWRAKQLRDITEAKLRRIATYLSCYLYWQVCAENGDTEPVWAAYDDIRRLEADVKYEYLGLKDSWL